MSRASSSSSVSTEACPVVPPLRRHLAFAAAKPPFGPPNDYYRFSSVPSCDTEHDCVVVRSSLLKQKTAVENDGVESSEWSVTSGCYGVSNSPFHTPVSAKGRMSARGGSKSAKAAPQTPLSTADSPALLAPSGNCRFDSSLGLLAKKFVNLIMQAEDGVLNLNTAAEALEVQKRRIYDITNVLEGIGLIEKKLKNRIRWKGLDVLREEDTDASFLQASVKNLSLEEHNLDVKIQEMHEKLKNFCEDENKKKLLFVTEEDIKLLPCFQHQTLIAIKAPHGTTLEVPDPEDTDGHPERRFRIILRSTLGPIDVYLVSQFEDSVEEVHNTEQSSSIRNASSSGSSEHPRTEVINTELSQTISKQLHPEDKHIPATSPNFPNEGMMKIVPAEVDNNEEYWLFSEADISITDMWTLDSTIEWSEMLQTDFKTGAGTEAEARTGNVTEQLPPSLGI